MACTTHHQACPSREEMIRELLEDIMQAHRDDDSPDYNHCEDSPCAWCEQAALVLASSPEPASPWISVEERLPEECHAPHPGTENFTRYKVLVSGRYGIEEGCWTGKAWLNRALGRIYRVTLWMPLPDPPEQPASPQQESAAG